jgi:LysM repeat protein
MNEDMKIKTIFLYTTIPALMVFFLFAFNSWGEVCPGYKLKTGLGFITFESGANDTTKSLKAKLELFKQSDPSIQWRIPNEADLEIIKKCPGLKSQLKPGIYYWTQIKIGIFYQCFKIDKTSGEMVMANRVSTDGAYGLFIDGKTAPITPYTVKPIIASETTGPTKDQLAAPGDNTGNTGERLSKPGPPANGTERYFKYWVKKNERLSSIARAFNLDTRSKGLERLAKLNKMPSRDDLKAKSYLTLPVPSSCKNGIVIEKYRVKPGDTLWSIALKYLGNSFFNKNDSFIDAICSWNGIRNKNRITINELTLYLCQ